MSDSVDRVFSHALNTVNKIRTGSEKPPTATRLKLYGLYKQSMEGDVDGIMDRPEGSGEDAHRQREKWDSWKQQAGLSRTEAKRRYISTLLETMHKYASPSPDARELVSELEFVWDQVKSNVPSSSSSSPPRPPGPPAAYNTETSYPALGSPRPSRGALRVLSPVSQHPDDDDDAALDEKDDDEFVDAPDSQYIPGAGSQSGSGERLAHSEAPPRAQPDRKPALVRRPSSVEQKWRRRMEQAVVKLTAEVAALREQLEARRLFNVVRRQSVGGLAARAFWFVVKHFVVDFVVLAVILLWMRRKQDRRLEGAVRVLLGDAVAQIQKVGQGGIARIGAVAVAPARKT